MFARSLGFRPLRGLGDNCVSDDETGIETCTPDVISAIGPDSTGTISFGAPAGGSGPLPGSSSTSLSNLFNSMWGAPVSGPTFSNPSNPSDTTNWTSVINNLISSGAKVAAADLTGTTITLPNGQTVKYAGVVPSSAQVSAAGGSSAGSLLLFAGVGVVLLLMMKRS